MPVSNNSSFGSMEIISMNWYGGKAPNNRPVLVICYESGHLLLMKNCTEEGMIYAGNA